MSPMITSLAPSAAFSTDFSGSEDSSPLTPPSQIRRREPSISRSSVHADPCRIVDHDAISTTAPMAVAGSSAVSLIDVRANRVQFLRAVAVALETHASEFRQILMQFDTAHGADYELRQAIRTLRGAEEHELKYLQQTAPLKNIAVYASRNIPLYSLVLHGIMPAMVSERVWLRTPQMTSSCYFNVFETLKGYLPQYDWSPLRLLRPINYDQFRKEYVLGLAHSGKRFDRGPCEVVIFVGSPETARKIIDTNLEKVRNLADKSAPFRQIFLKFGSGLNPAVVTEFCENNLEPAVNAAVESVRMNSSQDCATPKLFLVHWRVLHGFVERLGTRLAALKFGAPGDINADYTPLTLGDQERMEKLAAFRARHEARLKNREAILDPSSMRVDPHLFVFNLPEFKEVELVDHYAPFIVVFSYCGDHELREIANDPRLRERAMYASVFGDMSVKDMWKPRKLFEDNFHSTMSTHVFDEESGNVPFGGYSANASSVTVVQKETTAAGVHSREVSRPLLFSREARRYFPAEGAVSEVAPATVLAAPASPRSRALLRDTLEKAVDPEFAKTVTLYSYGSLRQPQTEIRLHGLAALRECIGRGGLRTLDWDSRPTSVQCAPSPNLLDEHERREVEHFVGAQVVDWKALRPQELVQVPGVMLFPSFVGGDVAPMNRVRGEITPHLSYGMMTPLLSDRRREYALLNAVWPGIMPRTLSFERIAFPPDLLMKRDAVRAQMNELLEQGEFPIDIDNGQLRRHMIELVHGVMQAVQQVFPHGAYLKNYDECTTGDLQIQIKSFHYDAERMVDQFIEHFFNDPYMFGPVWRPSTGSQSGGRSVINSACEPLASDTIKALLRRHVYATATKVIHCMLTDWGRIVASQRLDIAQSDLGFNREVRVDFIDGEPVNARCRYSHEYHPDDLEEAKRVVREFFRRARRLEMMPDFEGVSTEGLQLLCGGADLARLEDGTWKMIELNAGPYSGSGTPYVFPVEANQLISNLQGRNTWLIDDLERVFSCTPEKQNEVLAKRKNVEELWNKYSLNDISAAEIAKYLRNRYLDDWRQDPTSERAQATLDALKRAFANVGTDENRDLPLLIRGAETYINGVLEKRENVARRAQGGAPRLPDPSEIDPLGLDFEDPIGR